MTSLSDTRIRAIAEGLLDCSLPRSEWTHAAHFAAALWLIKQDRACALSRIRAAIRAYNEATGTLNTDTDGYHETITAASICAAADCLDKTGPNIPLCQVLDKLLRSEFGQSHWLLDYWSKERLFSTEARRSWVEPDLNPLPFS